MCRLTWKGNSPIYTGRDGKRTTAQHVPAHRHTQTNTSNRIPVLRPTLLARNRRGVGKEEEEEVEEGVTAVGVDWSVVTRKKKKSV